MVKRPALRTYTYPVLVGSILLLGFIIRVWHSETTPPGIYPDEAVNGIDALNALRHGQWQWFYPANNGREGLFINLIALSFKVFGSTEFALRFPAIIASTLTILGTYLLTKELFANKRLASIAAWLVATAFWSINFGRISFRANLLPLVLVFTFYFFWKGIHTKRYWPFIVSGCCFGLGIHTYIAARVTPLIIISLLLFLTKRQRGFFNTYWRQLVLFFCAAIVVAAPLLYTFWQKPDYLYSRTEALSIFSPAIGIAHVIPTLMTTISLSIIKYTLLGDHNWRHNYPPYPLLDPVTGLAFIVGFVLVINRILQRYPRIQNSNVDKYIFLVAWFGSMLIPEIMSIEGNPHALRSIGTLPVVFIIAAVAFEYGFTRSKRIATVALVGIVLLVGSFNVIKYYLFWAAAPQTAVAFYQSSLKAAKYIQTQPTDSNIVVIANPRQRLPIQLLNFERPNITYVSITAIKKTQYHSQARVVLIDANPSVVKRLRRRFPACNLTRFYP